LQKAHEFVYKTVQTFDIDIWALIKSQQKTLDENRSWIWKGRGEKGPRVEMEISWRVLEIWEGEAMLAMLVLFSEFVGEEWGDE
jgi:hypothetical protein